MTMLNAYDKRTGKKLPYLVPAHWFDHPVLGARISRLPSQKRRANPLQVGGGGNGQAAPPTAGGTAAPALPIPSFVHPVTTPAPAIGDNTKEKPDAEDLG